MAGSMAILLSFLGSVFFMGYSHGVQILRESPDPVNVPVGGDILLSCEDTDGDDLAWDKDGIQVLEDVRHTIVYVQDAEDHDRGKSSLFLMIDSAVLEDAGNYECRSVESPDKPTDSLNVTVYVPPSEEYHWDTGAAYVSCDHGYAIAINDAWFGELRSTGETEEPVPCEVSVLDVDEVYYHEIVQRCQGRMRCAGLEAKVGMGIRCFADGFVDGTAQYVKLSYRCTAGADQYEVARDSGPIEVICPVDSVIEVTGADFGDREGRHTCELPIAEEDEAYYDDIIERCEGRQVCDGLQAKTGGEMWCPGSYFYSDTINYVKLKYQCRSILEFEGQWQSGAIQIWCFAGTVLEIQGAYFGDSDGWITCEKPVQEEDTTYFENIMGRCDGRPTCEGLTADTDRDMWCPGSQFTPDSVEYIRLQYRCRHPEEYPPIDVAEEVTEGIPAVPNSSSLNQRV